MRTGQLRSKVELQKPSETKNEVGEVKTTWETEHEVWAQITALTGIEFYQSDQVESNVTHRVTIRWVAGLDSEWRILYGDRILEVNVIMDPQERKEQLQMLCREVI